MSSPPAMQSLWIGESLSTMERLSISSFLRNGHAYRLYVYDEVAGAPDGTTLMDANEIVPREKIFKYRHHDSYAGFANLFRYKLLFEKGGYWVDADMVCLKPMVGDQEYVFASERLRPPTTRRQTTAANCFIRVPIGSDLMEYCYKQAARKNPKKIRWGETGPRLLAQAVERFSMGSYVAEPGAYCPINWWDWNQFIDGSHDHEALAHSRAVHLYHEMWRRNGVDKSDRFDEACVYEQLKRAYPDPQRGNDVGFDTAPSLDTKAR